MLNKSRTNTPFSKDHQTQKRIGTCTVAFRGFLTAILDFQIEKCYRINSFGVLGRGFVIN